MNKKTIKSMMIVLMLLAVGLYFVSATYARYTSTASGTGTVQVAKWAVKINEKDATKSEEFTIEFTEKENANVVDGYIAPTSQLYADFKIDPTDSQVAIDYSFTLGDITASEGTIPETIKVLKVVPVTGITAENPFGIEGTALTATENVYSGTIELVDQETALTADEAVTMRVYVEWEDLNTSEANTTDTTVGVSAPTLTMTVNATATQDVD